jgi:pSer/pThr/pTyr-binding forkhead associated (FHA) protein
MDTVDFPTWFGIGSYGGWVTTILAAVSIATYASRRHRGTPLQLARSILVPLLASCFMLAAVWWNQSRLDLYGPTLSAGEITFWLCWTAWWGWGVPLGMLIGYLLLAPPQPVPVRAGPHGTYPPGKDRLADPGRQVEPLGAGRPWGRLIHLDGHLAERSLPLSRQLTLLGRELDNDIVLDDERASRHHAELRWDNGRVQVLDYGSMNGTLINGQAARGQVPLRSGDVLQFGSRTYRVEFLTSGALAHLPYFRDEPTHKVPRVPSQPRPATPPLVLVGLTGVAVGIRWQLSDPVMIIGREVERPIALPDPSVSRPHAQIMRQPAGYFISDLDSSNGTLLNGEPLTAPTLLSAGDVLRIGVVELRCEIATTAVPPTIPLDSQLRAQAEAGSDSGVDREYAAPFETSSSTLVFSQQPLAADEQTRSPVPQLTPLHLRPPDPSS